MCTLRWTHITLNCICNQDPNKYDDTRDAWMEAIREFNEYGAANFADRFRIDAGLAGQMYGFKATLVFC